MKNDRKDRGITLVALVITIIVMLILVGVTISTAVNGGLFDYAKKAAEEMNKAQRQEQELTELITGMETDEVIAYYSDLGVLKRYFEGHTSEEVGKGPFTNNEIIENASTSITLIGLASQDTENYIVFSYKNRKYTVTYTNTSNINSYVTVEKLIPLDVTEAVIKLNTAFIDTGEEQNESLRGKFANGCLLEDFTAEIADENIATIDGDMIYGEALENHTTAITTITLTGLKSGKTKTFELHVSQVYEVPEQPVGT